MLQSEADWLGTMPEKLTEAARAEFGMRDAGEGMTFALESLDGRTAFFVDANLRGKIKLTKCLYTERWRVVDVLSRLDIDGPPHTNPTVTSPPLPVLAAYNGATVPCPHRHFFAKGFEDRWAVPADVAGLNETDDVGHAS